MEAQDELDDFCKELKVKTQKIHDQSDKLINLKLLVVLTDIRLWASALANFYKVFQTLEKFLEINAAHPHIGLLYNKKIFRTSQFMEDLEYYLGSDWEANIQISDEARLYCDRLMQLSEENPTLLIAYVHSMYLALLAGGQILKRIVKRTLGLPSNEGLSIFTYDDDSKLELKSYIINTINGLELTREQKDAILKEKIRCFQMNNAIAKSINITGSSFTRIAQLLVKSLVVLLVIVAAVVYLYK